MLSRENRSGGPLSRAIVLASGVWTALAGSALAFQEGMVPPITPPPQPVMAPAPTIATSPMIVTAPAPPQSGVPIATQGAPAMGTLGYGGPGLYPGFQGFGLKYHLGYGYGGQGLGPGADGGYPLYGGPGYPHPAPALNRCVDIEPFFYFGGPGFPTPDHPHFFGGTGPLVYDEPVVAIETTVPDPGYGSFTGATPDPEGQFAQFTASAAQRGSRSGVITPTPEERPAPSVDAPTPPVPAPAPPRSTLVTPGIDAISVVDVGGVPALQVAQVYPGTMAEKAGLRPGDVIRSINGYATKVSGNIPWIIDNKAPDKILRLSVRTAADGKLHSLTMQVR